MRCAVTRNVGSLVCVTMGAITIACCWYICIYVYMCRCANVLILQLSTESLEAFVTSMGRIHPSSSLPFPSPSPSPLSLASFLSTSVSYSSLSFSSYSLFPFFLPLPFLPLPHFLLLSRATLRLVNKLPNGARIYVTNEILFRQDVL